MTVDDITIGNRHVGSTVVEPTPTKLKVQGSNPSQVQSRKDTTRRYSSLYAQHVGSTVVEPWPVELKVQRSNPVRVQRRKDPTPLQFTLRATRW